MARRLIWLKLLVMLAATMLIGVQDASAQTMLTKMRGGKQVRLSVDLGQAILPADQTKTTYLKVGLNGLAVRGSKRAPINVAVVLDRSSSMDAERLAKAKEAAIMLVDRLSPADTVSVVAYSHTVSVVVPATHARDRKMIRARIQALRSEGTTALFAGVSKGAHEVKKFLDRNRVNRVVLLSDGMANVGPSTPGELGNLGRALAKQGISVSTIGLGEGYNEDLMVALARQSDGNHDYARTANDLARIFDLEFKDLSDVVAREVAVNIRCAPGIRPIRTLGRDAEINGRHVVARINELYASHEKYVLLEVEVPAGVSGKTRDVASVEVRYANPTLRTTETLRAKATVGYSSSGSEVAKNQNTSVLVESAELIANDRNKQAVALRDQGKTAEAQRLLESNAAFLDEKGTAYNNRRLKESAAINREQKKRMPKPAAWKPARKAMRGRQHSIDQQMRR